MSDTNISEDELLADLRATRADAKALAQQEIDAELINRLCNVVEKHRATIDAKNAEIAELRKKVETMKPICDEIVATMNEYDRQFAEQKGWVDSPGGLKHMGDVWRLLRKWREAIKSTDPKGEGNGQSQH